MDTQKLATGGLRIAAFIVSCGVIARPILAEDLPSRTKANLSIALLPDTDESGAHVIPHGSEFHVLLENHSDQPIRLWDQWCPRAHGTLSFQVQDEDGNSWMMRPIADVVSMDGPIETFSIAPGGKLKWGFNLSRQAYQRDQLWGRVPEANTGKTFTLEAIFEIQPSETTEEHRVWTGRINQPVDHRQIRQPRSENATRLSRVVVSQAGTQHDESRSQVDQQQGK